MPSSNADEEILQDCNRPLHLAPAVRSAELQLRAIANAPVPRRAGALRSEEDCLPALSSPPSKRLSHITEPSRRGRLARRIAILSFVVARAVTLVILLRPRRG